MGNNQYLSSNANDISIAQTHGNTFDLYLDYSSKTFLVRGTPVPLFKRKPLLDLLHLFLTHSSKSLTLRYIFESVWQKQYDPETDVYTVRMNVKRLRDIIENGDQVILTVKNPTSAYCLRPNLSFRLIAEKEYINTSDISPLK
jgi:DNA-binding response OmpR family regulator